MATDLLYWLFILIFCQILMNISSRLIVFTESMMYVLHVTRISSLLRHLHALVNRVPLVV